MGRVMIPMANFLAKVCSYLLNADAEVNTFTAYSVYTTHCEITTYTRGGGYTATFQSDRCTTASRTALQQIPRTPRWRR